MLGWNFLFMLPGIYAAQDGNGRTAGEPIKKHAVKLLLAEKKNGNRPVRVLLARLWVMTDK